MKKRVLRRIERSCTACNGTGIAPVKQPARPGVRVYPPRCAKCLGKGRVAKLDASSPSSAMPLGSDCLTAMQAPIDGELWLLVGFRQRRGV
jgi:hypothetical protein